MNVLLIGAGGREHALAWKITQSRQLGKLLTVPGNTGTARHGTNVPFPLNDVDALVDLAQREAIDLVVVGPDNPLADGIVDHFNAAGIRAFGPTAAAARIESSKSFAKEIMAEAGVPTAAAHIFDDPAAARAFAQQSGQAWVVKADGLALGKGVVVAETVEETLQAIEQMSSLAGGKRLLLEERLTGNEISLLAFCDGKRLLALPTARDYKRLLDGDRGPNTGGMGVFAPVDAVGPELADQIVRTCMQPVVDGLAQRGTPFQGILYAGVILTAQGPKILEFNARFGDPEAQALLPLIDGDILAIMQACADGKLQPELFKRRKGYAVCVVLSAEGYPAKLRRGDAIHGIEALDMNNVIVFHAGTSMSSTGLTTSGGRVLNVTGLGPTLKQARERAYDAIKQIAFEGRHFRKDIGA